jgi:chemotaxis methyl-accepting protein methylase
MADTRTVEVIRTIEETYVFQIPHTFDLLAEDAVEKLLERTDGFAPNSAIGTAVSIYVNGSEFY